MCYPVQRKKSRPPPEDALNIRAKTTTRAAEGLPRRRFTVAEVEAMVEVGVMDEDERVELIGGELVPMSPKGNQHEVIKTLLLKGWIRACPDSHLLTPETTFRMSQDTFLEPDVVVYPLAIDLDKLTGQNVELVVEIAASSRRYDTGRKAKLYASFGVRELWVIDAVKRRLTVFLEPAASGYQQIAEYGGEARVTPKFAPSELALSLDALKLR